eukprot:scaffold12233_cov129-Isochrysis_galbana.AAC.2
MRSRHPARPDARGHNRINRNNLHLTSHRPTSPVTCHCHLSPASATCDVDVAHSPYDDRFQLSIAGSMRLLEP